MASSAPSWWRLSSDLIIARALVWISLVGRDADLTADAHLYFADRYTRLANIHERHGRLGRARRLREKADYHLGASGFTGPPYAAAMGMPRPRQMTVTNAISGHDGPDAAA